MTETRRPGILAMVYNDIRRDARVRQISEALTDQYDVTLISIAPPGAGPPPPGSFRIVELPIDHLGRFPRTKYVLYWLRSFLRARSLAFDAIHCHDVYPLPVAGVLARLRGVPLIYDAHELVDHVRAPQTLMGRFWDAAHRRGVRSAELVIAANPSRARFLQEEGYHPRRPPVSVMNVGGMSSATGGALHQTREDVGVPEEAYLVIYQGWIAGGRHSVALVEAMARLEDRLHLLMVGDGPAMPAVRRRVQDLSLEGRVHLTGYLPKERVLELVAASDVGIVLYDDRVLNNYYCAPNKLFDYLGAGIPVVASDLPEPRRVIEGTGVGVLVGGPAPEGIAAAIRRAMGLRPPATAFEAIRARFSWGGEVQRLLAAYSSVLPTERSG